MSHTVKGHLPAGFLKTVEMLCTFHQSIKKILSEDKRREWGRGRGWGRDRAGGRDKQKKKEKKMNSQKQLYSISTDLDCILYTVSPSVHHRESICNKEKTVRYRQVWHSQQRNTNRTIVV